MINEKWRKPQNTTVSSVIALGTYSLHQKKIEAVARQRRQKLSQNMTVEEAVEGAARLIEEMGGDQDARRVRVVVYENPFARMPLSRGLFHGPFDGRWSADGGVMRRVFVGEKIIRSDDSLNSNPRET